MISASDAEPVGAPAVNVEASDTEPANEPANADDASAESVSAEASSAEAANAGDVSGEAAASVEPASDETVVDQGAGETVAEPDDQQSPSEGEACEVAEACDGAEASAGGEACEATGASAGGEVSDAGGEVSEGGEASADREVSKSPEVSERGEAVAAGTVLTAGTAAAAEPDKDQAKAPTSRRRDPLWARLAIAFGLVLVLMSGAAVGAGVLLVHRYEHTVTQETLLAPEARVNAQEVHHSSVKGPLNFLLLGSDARADNPSNGQRSDTIIIAHVPASMDRAYLVSIPRDLRVHIPAYPATGFKGAYEKINGAFQYGGGGNGGVQLLSQTLTNVLGIQFDGAAIVDFSGFSKVVDELDGIDMCVDQRVESIHIGFDKDGKFLAPRTGPEAEYHNPLSTPMVYEPGCRHFVGWQALDYVRQRKTLPNGDYDRQRHQQQFLRAILARAREKGVTSDPLLIDKLVRAIGDSLTVDANGLPLTDLAFALRGVLPGAIGGVTVPSEPQMIGGISYIIGLPEQDGLYRALREDKLESWTVENPTWYNRQ